MIKKRLVKLDKKLNDSCAWYDFFIPLDSTTLMKSFKYEHCFSTDLFMEDWCVLDRLDKSLLSNRLWIEYTDSIETIR